MVDGKFIPLSELCPKFKIPTEEGPGNQLDEILRMITDNPQVCMITEHVSVEEALRLLDLSEQYDKKTVVVSSAAVQESSIIQPLALLQ